MLHYYFMNSLISENWNGNKRSNKDKTGKNPYKTGSAVSEDNTEGAIQKKITPTACGKGAAVTV